MRAVGYIRVSTEEQGNSGLGLSAQTDAIELEVNRRGWDLVKPLYRDEASGKSMKGRPHLSGALAALDAGDADVLVVAKLDRLSRSVADFCSLVARANDGGWALVVVDFDVDTSTPAGKMLATVMMAFAEWEREMIAQRTRDALAAKKRSGVQLGRRSNVDPDTLALIRTLRRANSGWKAIAKVLNDRGIPTAQGGKAWYPATVRKLYETDARRGELDVDEQLLPV